MTELMRLVLDYRTGELVVRCLYSTQDGPNPGTVRRRREVSDLVREGLQDALTALESGRVDVVGTSGYTTREDVLCITEGAECVSSVHKKLKKGA
jgi:hypothetical protein